jgi:hypothetical protein
MKVFQRYNHPLKRARFRQFFFEGARPIRSMAVAVPSLMRFSLGVRALGQEETKGQVEEILRSHGRHISELEHIKVDTVGLEDVDWRISIHQNAMDGATYSKMARHLPRVSFHEMRSSQPVLISDTCTVTCLALVTRRSAIDNLWATCSSVGKSFAKLCERSRMLISEFARTWDCGAGHWRLFRRSHSTVTANHHASIESPTYARLRTTYHRIVMHTPVIFTLHY